MRLLYNSLHKLSLKPTSSVLMGSKQFLKSTFFSNPLTPASHRRLSNTRKLPFSAFPSKPTSRTQPCCLIKTNGYSSVSEASDPRAVVLEDPEEKNASQFRILKQKLEDLGLECDISVPGQFNHLICPMCNGGDQEERSLSLFIEQDGSSALWVCFRAKCGWRGSTRAFAESKPAYERPNKIARIKKIREITIEDLGLEPPCDEIVAYFSERMISKETMQRNAVMQKRYDDQFAIAFTYWRNGNLISCKYRDINKKFWQEADTEKIFYGLDDIKEASDIIIVEGEMDKLAMEEAGFRNCVSVPDGAPPCVSEKDLPPKETDTKYQYLWNCKEYLKKASRIILATDGDVPGQALAEELARRVGRERCWRVKWPKKNEVDHFKDANEVLMYMGPDVLKEVIENAELYPIRGLFNFKDYFSEIDAYYYRTFGDEFGASTGWRSLNHLYNVVLGELTVVTGVPNSGKSEWIDALLCNLNESMGWKFALCSMENKVREHARKLLEKHMKKPFFNVRYGESAQRMSPEELEQGKEWLNETFHLIRCEDDALPSIKWVLDLAKAAVLRHGVRGLVIDPYNELDHQRPSSQTETEYVSQMLTQVKRFAQHHACHVWFVAHPRQLQNWAGEPPNLYDISGSAHFINKCDNGIVVHRNRDPDAGPVDQVQIIVRKVRNKVAGTIGEAYLAYDRVTGRYIDIQ
ncbi:twinkle homolog protein, chloroplastic/mitochondrial isoform X1 [Morus notabilis]|uniref:twinkle homolog protein, chloroplastic/mitochondrial isoform X1 n=1 Tax=Morus notabilis TaxID=981085 RepID=UPI000CED219A|nr:twinkle homolog protein, chloroplastic/mitochondrial isoform X1 [Morus notabilis]